MERAEMASRLCNEIEPLKRFSVSLARDSSRADDLVQDTIERAICKAHLFEGDNLRPWLFTVCRRLFLNRMRRQKLRGAHIPTEDAPADAFQVAASQEDVMEYRDVVDAFRTLSLNDKVILTLVAVEGMTYEEASEILEIPVGTVRSRLSRARSKLQSILEERSEGTKIAA